ncbi:MAG TPA: dihydrolipoamide acetyltransferase family protein [Streptosporangiaceae bacterium]|jgi:pyruvate dehydrogenase E2 component (dihydrolipoamide acetyltransferase)
MPDFLLPDLGEGLEEAEVIAWRVRVGDQVTVDQVVAEVETAKAAVEVPIPFAGQVTALHAEPGTTLAVGTPLITINTTLTPDAPAPGLQEPGIVTPAAPVAAAPAGAGLANGDGEASGNVLIGYGTTPTARRTRIARRRGRPVSQPSGPKTPMLSGPSAPAVAAAAARTGPVPVISPVVRKLARDAGLDLSRVTGTGPEGLVRRHDVEQALATQRATPIQPTPPAALTPAAPAVQHPATTDPAPITPATRTALASPAAPAAPAAAEPAPAAPAAAEPVAGERRIPLRGVRKTVADKLTRSRREIPEATVWVDADATALLATRAELNAQPGAQPVSLLALLARFAVAGLRRYPELNARLDGDEIVIPAHVHLGFAAQTDRGLVVPVVRDAHHLSARELSAALAQRTEAARAGHLSPADLTGGTFTVNNYGVFGVDGSAAIINYPEVAILGIGRIIDRPWVVDGQVVPRKITELTLAFDHRVCDGGTAGGFLRYVADCLESPTHPLADL